MDVRNFIKLVGAGAGFCLLGGSLAAQEQKKAADEVKFTSVPDLFNWNIGNPQEGWEETISWFFDLIQKEGPDFNLNAGDIMDARWYEIDLVKKKTEQYWKGFRKRFDERGLKCYVAPGDHEYGDDGGLRKGDIAREFGKQFTKLMGMPTNGPKNHLGRSYYVREKNLLVITLDTFEDEGKKFGYTVGKEQIEWMEKVLADNKDADFVIVQGHLPIAGPVKSKHSSSSMMKGGTKNALWQLMVKHKVDAYLCGEHHRITVKKVDGIWQIVHGALWGTQTDLNYLRGLVNAKQMKLDLLTFNVNSSGGDIGDHPQRGAKNRPREIITLTEETKKQGSTEVGSLVIKLGDGGAKTEEISGCFKVNGK